MDSLTFLFVVLETTGGDGAFLSWGPKAIRLSSSLFSYLLSHSLLNMSRVAYAKPKENLDPDLHRIS